MGAIVDHIYKGCGHDTEKWTRLKWYWGKIAKLGFNLRDTEGVLADVDNTRTGEASAELLNHSYDHLQKAVDTVYPDVYGDERYTFKQGLKKNVAEFALFKSASFAENLKGKTKEERTAILNAYERQLDVEGTLTTRIARSAKQWQEIERTSNLYPNIEYLSSRSVDKRPEHEKYYGLILPINHPFWDTNYPPNGWNCKCRARKSDGDIYQGEIPKITHPKGITGNAGKTGEVFRKDHPLISSFSKAGKTQLKKQFESLKLELPYNKADYKAKNESSITVHLYADEKDLKDNFDAAKLVADQLPKTNIKIRPHGIGTGRNPEYLINGKIADLKLNKGAKVSSSISLAKGQGCEVVVFRMTDKSHLTVSRLIERVNGELIARPGHKFERIIIIDKSGKVIDLKTEKGKLI